MFVWKRRTLFSVATFQSLSRRAIALHCSARRCSRSSHRYMRRRNCRGQRRLERGAGRGIPQDRRCGNLAVRYYALPRYARGHGAAYARNSGASLARETIFVFSTTTIIGRTRDISKGSRPRSKAFPHGSISISVTRLPISAMSVSTNQLARIARGCPQ